MPRTTKKTGDVNVSDEDAAVNADDPQPAQPESASASAPEQPEQQPESAPQDALQGAEPSAQPESAAPTVIRTERHYGASDAFGYHLEIPGGYIEVEYLSDGSVRSADGAHPLDAAVFVRPPAEAEE